MTRIRPFRLALFLLLVVLAMTGCRREDDTNRETERALAYLSPDTSILIAIYLPAFAETEAFRNAESDLLDTDEIGPVLREMEMPLREAVEWLYIGVVDDPASDGEVAALVRTNLGDDFLQNVMARQERTFRREEQDGAEIWVLRGPEEAVALTALEGGYLGFGPADAVRAMARRGAGKERGLSDRSPLFEAVERPEEDRSVWGVAQMTSAVQRQMRQNPMMRGLAAVHHLVWSAENDPTQGLTLELDAVCDSEEDAVELRSQLEMLVGFAGLSQDVDPLLAEILTTFSVQVRERTAAIRFVVPPEALSALTDLDYMD